MSPCHSGTGTTRTPPTSNGPVDLVRLELRNAAAQPRHAVERVVERARGCRPRSPASRSTGSAPPCMQLKRRISSRPRM